MGCWQKPPPVRNLPRSSPPHVLSSAFPSQNSGAILAIDGHILHQTCRRTSCRDLTSRVQPQFMTHLISRLASFPSIPFPTPIHPGCCAKKHHQTQRLPSLPHSQGVLLICCWFAAAATCGLSAAIVSWGWGDSRRCSTIERRRRGEGNTKHPKKKKRRHAANTQENTNQRI